MGFIQFSPPGLNYFNRFLLDPWSARTGNIIPNHGGDGYHLRYLTAAWSQSLLSLRITRRNIIS